MADKKEYEVTTIATSTAPGVMTPEGEIITLEEGIVIMLNSLAKLEETLIGKK